MTDGTTTCDFAAGTTYGIRQMSLSTPALDVIWAGSRRSTYDHPSDFTFRNRSDVLIVSKLTASNHNNWVTAQRNLQNLLTESLRYYNTRGDYGAPAYLDVQLNGMSNSIRYDILAGSIDPGAEAFAYPMKSQTAPTVPNTSVKLTLKPWGRPSTSTSTTSGSLTNSGAIATITAPAGDWDPAAKVSLNLGAAVNGIRFIMWSRSRGTVAQFLRYLEAEIGTFTNANGTTTDYGVANKTTAPSVGWDAVNEVDAAASGGNRLDVIVSGVSIANTYYPINLWSITSNIAAHRGTYQVFARVRMPVDDPGANTKLQLRWGGATGTDRSNDGTRADWTVLHATDWRLLDLGTMTIPHRSLTSTVNYGNCLFTLYGSGNAGTSPAHWEIDCIYLVPIDGPIMDVKLNSISSAQDKVVSDYLDVRPALYATSSADVPIDQYFGSGSTMLHTGFWLQRNVDSILSYLVMDDTNNKHVLADTATITVEFYPYYWLFR